jgi:succinate dehydrogenase flavin-adding protein (antitoxin of CptAB toxin-antitoxin module)
LNALLELPDDDLWDIVVGRSDDFDPQLSRIVKRLRATSVARPFGAA